ncbi:MAG: protein kinase [Deltaproteobacteria bacterium]|nr:protein kinase [Deltaproteobacteria bacterium]
MRSAATAQGEHEKLEELGRGGVGIVHLARRRADGAVVVLKQLRPELARNVTVRRIFAEEARIAALVSHPNVVAVTGKGFASDGTPWIEMEWIPGVTLDAVTDVAPLPLPLFAWVLSEVLTGLDAAHHALGDDGKALDLVHRDLSPHNVLVALDGRVKVLDFGIAKVRDSSVETSSGVVKGKATYLAPEQAAREQVDARTDLFAVGVCLWQAVANRRMWEGMTEVEIFHRLVTGEIPPLPEPATRDAAPELCALVARALARDPDARPPTAAVFRDELLAALPPPSDAREQVGRHVSAAFEADVPSLRAGRALARADDATIVQGARSRSRRAPIAAAAFILVAAIGGGTAIVRGTLGPRAPTAPPTAIRTMCERDTDCGSSERCLEGGRCATLVREGCRVLASTSGAAGRAPPFVIGAMFPLTGPAAEAYGRSNARAAELAVSEIQKLAGGIPSRAGLRPLVLVTCDDATSRDEPARHIAERASAVVGYRTSDEALTLTRDVFAPAGVVSVSALNSSPLLAQLPQGSARLFFRATASATTFAAPVARIVDEVAAPSVRSRRSLAALSEVRVAVVRAGDATGISYADMVMRSLAGTRGLRVREIAAGRSDDDGGGAASAVDELVRMRPDVVVALRDDFFGSIAKPLEDKLGGPEPQRPLYVAGTPWEGDDFVAFVKSAPERTARFLAVSWPTRHRAMEGFIQRYKDAFGEELLPSTASPAPYDAIYLVAYAAAAAGGRGRADGPALSREVLALRAGGARLEVGPNDVVRGLAAAFRGDPLDLDGIVTRLDFDPATGDTAVDAVVLCTTFDAKSGQVDAIDARIAAGACARPVDTSASRPR